VSFCVAKNERSACLRAKASKQVKQQHSKQATASKKQASKQATATNKATKQRKAGNTITSNYKQAMAMATMQ